MKILLPSGGTLNCKFTDESGTQSGTVDVLFSGDVKSVGARDKPLRALEAKAYTSVECDNIVSIKYYGDDNSYLLLLLRFIF